MLLNNNKTPIRLACATLFAVMCFMIACQKVNLEWHKYEKRDIPIRGPEVRAKSVHVVSHGWKIIGPVDDQSKTYDWGWEVTVKIDPYDEPQPEKITNLIEIESMEYILYDKDGFELARDSLSIEKWHNTEWNDGGIGILQEYGEVKTYKQTSTLSKSKAVRAFEGKYIVNIK